MATSTHTHRLSRRSRSSHASLSFTKLLPLLLLALVVLLAQPASAKAGDKCSAATQCDDDAPCCGHGGTCGSGSEACAGGCNPVGSFSAGSCLPQPICLSQTINFPPQSYNNQSVFRPIMDFTGNPEQAPFTLDSGKLGQGQEGVILALTAPSQAKISSTRYILYGDIELEARHDAVQGLVFAFITMSNTRDEIDWEHTTASAQDLQTNFFFQGATVNAQAAGTIQAPTSSFASTDFHTYGIEWTPTAITWKIDGRSVRSVRASNFPNFPSSPSLIQVSVWAGGNVTNPEGVVAWSGGPIDWTSQQYKTSGYYSAEIKSMSIKCADPNSGNSRRAPGDATAPAYTSWVYTGEKSANGAPAFKLSTDPIKFLKDPGADGNPHSPGGSLLYGSDNKALWGGEGADSSSGSDKGGTWFTKQRILTIIVPAVGGFILLVIVWAVCVACRRRRSRHNRPSTKGGISNSNVTPGGGLFAGAGTVITGAKPATRYAPLDSQDDAPQGAQRVGGGIGPAAGPTPSRGGHWADPSHASGRSYSADAEMEQQQQQHYYNQAHSPAASQYSYRAEGYAANHQAGFSPAPAPQQHGYAAGYQEPRYAPQQGYPQQQQQQQYRQPQPQRGYPQAQQQQQYGAGYGAQSGYRY